MALPRLRVQGRAGYLRRYKMGLPVIMWSVWGIVALSFTIMKIYTMRLGRDEEDILVLDDTAMSAHQAEQTAVLSKLHKAEPIQRILMWGLLAMSLIVVVYYVVDAIH